MAIQKLELLQLSWGGVGAALHTKAAECFVHHFTTLTLFCAK